VFDPSVCCIHYGVVHVSLGSSRASILMGDWERTGCVYNLVASARSSDQTAVQNYKSFTVRSFKFLGLEKIRRLDPIKIWTKFTISIFNQRVEEINMI